jgi:hypothetical protein
MTSKRASALLLVLPVLFGALPACRSSESLEPSAASVLVSAAPVEITLASSLRRWRQTAEPPGSQTSYRLGKLLTRLFPAHDGHAFLSPVAAELESGAGTGAGQGFEARCRFTLTLQLDGANHPVDAHGVGRSRDDLRAAERAALEDCVSSIYAQVSGLLARKGP